MFLENEFYLMNKDDRILRFTCDNSPLGVSFKEEESYEEIRPYGYDGIGQWISQRQAPKHRQYIADLLRMCGCYNLDGFMVDNDTMQIKRMAPMFDHNQALLPYAEQEDFENLDVYLASRPTQIGEDFNEIAHALLTPEIRNDLKNLRGFEFQRNDEFNLPEERLQKLNKLVDQQIDGILECKRLYVPSNEYENARYQPEQYDDLSPESKEIDEELEI